MAAAERLVREALAARPDVALAHYNLALIAEARGDARTAESEYQQELKRHPDSYKAAFNLSLVYESRGQRQQQIDALKQAIAGNPRFAEGYFVLAKAYLRLGRQPGRGRPARETGTGPRAQVADGGGGAQRDCDRGEATAIARGRIARRAHAMPGGRLAPRAWLAGSSESCRIEQ